jgi:hypothetical protein
MIKLDRVPEITSVIMYEYGGGEIAGKIWFIKLREENRQIWMSSFRRNNAFIASGGRW